MLASEAVAVGMAGAGPAARAIGRALRACGITVAYVASRDAGHAGDAARCIGGGTRAVTYGEMARQVSHVLIAVSDHAIEAVAREMAGAGGTLRVALHTCGSQGTEPLEALRAIGVSCGSLHPLQTLRDAVRGAAALRGAAFAVEGDAAALAWAEGIAAALDGRVLRVPPAARPVYHAAAVMASNYVAALLDGAEQLMLLAGVPPGDALPALAPLARASLDNVFESGAVEALTGPVARGDAATVAAHLAALRDAAPSLGELYCAAGLHAVEMARRRGLDGVRAEAVRQALLGGR